MGNFNLDTLNLMSEDCYENYFVDQNYFDGHCFKALLSKGLGFAIIAGSVLVKVPQIVKILNNKSVEGINLMSLLLDLSAITLHMSYNFVSGFPFSSWGDSTFLAIQTMIIGALLIFYNGSLPKSILFTISYGMCCYALMSGLTPLKFLWAAQCCNIPILLLGKLSQAYTNFNNKSTGQLSAATCFLLFAGSLARIFTSIQETGDPVVILICLSSAFANGVIVVQLLQYWNNKTKVDKKSRKTKKAD